MGDKIQGEGDYEAGRRFQKEEQEFVRRNFGNKSGKERAPLEDGMDDLDIHASDAGQDELEDDEDTQIADHGRGRLSQNGQNGVSRKRLGDQGQSQRR